MYAKMFTAALLMPTTTIIGTISMFSKRRNKLNYDVPEMEKKMVE